MSEDALEQRLRQLRTAFDSAFAAPEATEQAARDELLRIRVGDDRYLLRVEELAGLRQGPRVLRLPTSAAAFLGVVRERSQLLAVFDLAALIGPSRSTDRKWLVLPRRAEVALAFDGFEGHLRISKSELLATAPAEPLVTGAVPVDGAPAPILSLEAVLARLAAYERAGGAMETS